MSQTLVLNSSNVVSGSNNSQFTFKFMSGSYTIPDGSTMSLRQAIIPYSWFNINAGYYNNASFTYTWVDGVVFTVTLTNGYYDITDINNALQLSFIANGLYLVDSTGNNVYYINLVIDSSAYAYQALFFLVPLSLPVGYTVPSNLYVNFYSVTTQKTPFIIISSSNNFGSIIGFTSGNYPSTNSLTAVNFISNTLANATPVNSIIMRCNLIKNDIAMPTDVLDSFTFQNTSFGSNGVYAPNFESNINLKSGTYSSLTITLVDQNFNRIAMNDSNVLITLLIKLPVKK
jgi:hypothetical protein